MKIKVGTALQVGARISWSCKPGFSPRKASCRAARARAHKTYGIYLSGEAMRAPGLSVPRYVHAAGMLGCIGMSCIDAGNGRSHIYFDLEFIPLQALYLEVGVTGMLP